MFNLTIKFICLDSAKSFAWIKLTAFKTSEHSSYFFWVVLQLLKVVPEFKKPCFCGPHFLPK